MSIWGAMMGAAASGGGGGGSFDFTPLLVGLGPFAVTAGALIWHITDLRERRKQQDAHIDSLTKTIEKKDDEFRKMMELVLPALAEGRETVRDNTRTMADAVKAMEGLGSVAGRIPDTTEVALMRRLLAQRSE
jgi:hypothetical protein